ncbi:Centrin-2 [Phytophthora citrophthora]|uniref:Centrin-2 n=1 Tax=Phytophthora citrophthora TaxID=4793 RepID=A0AAD9GI84_9STRA|nr:Centrin-2 [Phytophthora citrophthora]
MTTLRRIKDKQLTAAQEREHRAVFELTAEGSNVMTVKQLKLCLRAMGFNVAKGEAQALVYEFDYTDSNSIDLADFQKICLAKVSELLLMQLSELINVLLVAESGDQRPGQV